MAMQDQTVEWRPPANLMDNFDRTVQILRASQRRNDRIDRHVVLNAAVMGFYCLPSIDQQHWLDAYQSALLSEMYDEAAEAATAAAP